MGQTHTTSAKEAKRIAASGLNLQQISLIYARGGYDGLRSVLSANPHGSNQSRVTALQEGLEGAVRVPGKKVKCYQTVCFEYVR